MNRKDNSEDLVPLGNVNEQMFYKLVTTEFYADNLKKINK